MQHSPSEIKEKLLRALDKEYNVINYGAVEDVIGVLEKMPITKEVLETTRLGRYVNELRKKTTDELLAKRAKGLVRQWRHMIMPERQSPAHRINGASVSASACASAGASPVQSGATPGHGASPGPRSPAGSPGRPPHHVDSVPRTIAANKRLRKDESDDGAPPAKVVRQMNGGLDADSPLESVPVVEVSVTTSRRRRAHRSTNCHLDDIVKEKLASAARALRVKTTQELLAGLSSCGGSGSYTPPCTTPEPKPVSPVMRPTRVHSSVTCAQPREFVSHSPCLSPAPSVQTLSPTPSPIDVTTTVVTVAPVTPNSVRLPSVKRVRTSRPNASSILAAQTVRSPPPAPSPSLSLSTAHSTLSLPNTVASGLTRSGHTDVEIAEIMSRLPPIDVSIVHREETPPPIPLHYRAEDLLNGHIDSVTGNMSHDGEVREWHECVSRTTAAGKLLHILPYTIID